MVVWLFAGGGETEIGGSDNAEAKNKGLRIFLEKNFKNCTFERKLPIRRKPSNKPGAKPTIGSGFTGASLAKQIKDELGKALKQGRSDLILVVDDLDCRDPDKLRDDFDATIKETVKQAGVNFNPAQYVAFAAPEMESWIIADWEHTIEQDSDFRDRHAKR